MLIYCLKCKAKKEAVNPKAETTKNGRPGTSGTCPDCSGKLYRIGASPELVK